ncbi:MAG: hypothetical protein FWE38_05420 [Firmicutes bacterium]|nr:hypothetical protein [Bacillota bacterium]
MMVNAANPQAHYAFNGMPFMGMNMMQTLGAMPQFFGPTQGVSGMWQATQGFTQPFWPAPSITSMVQPQPWGGMNMFQNMNVQFAQTGPAQFMPHMPNFPGMAPITYAPNNTNNNQVNPNINVNPTFNNNAPSNDIEARLAQLQQRRDEFVPTPAPATAAPAAVNNINASPVQNNNNNQTVNANPNINVNANPNIDIALNPRFVFNLDGKEMGYTPPQPLKQTIINNNIKNEKHIHQNQNVFNIYVNGRGAGQHQGPEIIEGEWREIGDNPTPTPIDPKRDPKLIGVDPSKKGQGPNLLKEPPLEGEVIGPRLITGPVHKPTDPEIIDGVFREITDPAKQLPGVIHLPGPVAGQDDGTGKPYIDEFGRIHRTVEGELPQYPEGYIDSLNPNNPNKLRIIPLPPAPGAVKEDDGIIHLPGPVAEVDETERYNDKYISTIPGGTGVVAVENDYTEYDNELPTRETIHTNAHRVLERTNAPLDIVRKEKQQAQTIERDAARGVKAHMANAENFDYEAMDAENRQRKEDESWIQYHNDKQAASDEEYRLWDAEQRRARGRVAKEAADGTGTEGTPTSTTPSWEELQALSKGKKTNVQANFAAMTPDELAAERKDFNAAKNDPDRRLP